MTSLFLSFTILLRSCQLKDGGELRNVCCVDNQNYDHNNGLDESWMYIGVAICIWDGSAGWMGRC